MRRTALTVAALAAVFSAPVFASPIVGLVDTGSAGLGNVDTNYHFAATSGTFIPQGATSPVTYNAGTARGTSSSGVVGCTGGANCYGVAGTYKAWTASAAPASLWLAPTAETGQTYDGQATGSYTWTLDFNLYNFKNAAFTAQWASDNEGYVTLNGQTLTGSTIYDGYPAFQQFTGFSDLTDSGSSALVLGKNQLVFHVFNVGQPVANPTGINVDFLSSNVIPAPVPASALLFVSAMGALAVFGRKRGRNSSVNSVAV